MKDSIEDYYKGDSKGDTRSLDDGSFVIASLSPPCLSLDPKSLPLQAPLQHPLTPASATSICALAQMRNFMSRAMRKSSCPGLC